MTRKSAPPKFTHFVAYEPEVPGKKDKKGKKAKQLFVAPIEIKPKLATGLGSPDANERMKADRFFCDLARHALKCRWPELRRMKTPERGELTIISPDEVVDYLAARKKKTWQHKSHSRPWSA